VEEALTLSLVHHANPKKPLQVGGLAPSCEDPPLDFLKIIFNSFLQIKLFCTSPSDICSIVTMLDEEKHIIFGTSTTAS